MKRFWPLTGVTIRSYFLQDAHNCILDFDDDASFFAVYDGHGGSEVAVYTSQELPHFLKSTVNYKDGFYKEALIDAFLGFDDTIPSPEVLDKLKDIRDQELIDSKGTTSFEVPKFLRPLSCSEFIVEQRAVLYIAISKIYRLCDKLAVECISLR